MICKYNHALCQYGHPYPGQPLACTATSTAYVWTVRGPSGDSFQFWRGFVSLESYLHSFRHLKLSMTDACYGNLSISEKRWSTLKRCEYFFFLTCSQFQLLKSTFGMTCSLSLDMQYIFYFCDCGCGCGCGEGRPHMHPRMYLCLVWVWHFCAHWWTHRCVSWKLEAQQLDVGWNDIT